MKHIAFTFMVYVFSASNLFAAGGNMWCIDSAGELKGFIKPLEELPNCIGIFLNQDHMMMGFLDGYKCEYRDRTLKSIYEGLRKGYTFLPPVIPSHRVEFVHGKSDLIKVAVKPVSKDAVYIELKFSEGSHQIMLSYNPLSRTSREVVCMNSSNSEY